MKLAIGCDHGGFPLKAAVIEHVKAKGCEVEDFGCYSAESVDYPVYGERVARAVAGKQCDLGILICGTGIGISMAANRVKGIRAAVCSEPYSAMLTRQHNDANIICFGARVVGEGVALSIVDAFLDAEFMGGRHAKRVAMMEAIDRD